MKYLYIFIISIAFNSTNFAQEYTVTPTTDWVEFVDMNEVIISGYDGKEIIIEFDEDVDTKKQETSKGLKLWDQGSFVDKGVMGLKIKQKNKVLLIKQVASDLFDAEINYKIKVPRNMNIKYQDKDWLGNVVEITEMNGTLEISTNHNNIILNNNTGPMAVKSVYGSIDAIFSQVSQEGSISLYSAYQDIDVSIPKSTKSNLQVITDFGNIYSDLEVNVDLDNSKSGGIVGSKMVGDINQGGVDILLQATYGNVYLRGQ